jgi:hypothetical protein
MDVLSLSRLHLNLECVDIDENGCLVRIPGLDPDTIHLYSHRQENLASQAVAQSLGLLLYMEDAGYA